MILPLVRYGALSLAAFATFNVSIAGAEHFGHEEAPEQVNEQLSRFLTQVYGP